MRRETTIALPDCARHLYLWERCSIKGIKLRGRYALMATIVNLSDYRGQRKAERSDAPAAEGAKPGPHYFCTRCESDRFKLFSSGVVHCAQCSALMRNITVAETEQGKAGSK